MFWEELRNACQLSGHSKTQLSSKCIMPCTKCRPSEYFACESIPGRSMAAFLWRNSASHRPACLICHLQVADSFFARGQARPRQSPHRPRHLHPLILNLAFRCGLLCKRFLGGRPARAKFSCRQQPSAHLGPTPACLASVGPMPGMPERRQGVAGGTLTHFDPPSRRLRTRLVIIIYDGANQTGDGGDFPGIHTSASSSLRRVVGSLTFIKKYPSQIQPAVVGHLGLYVNG